MGKGDPRQLRLLEGHPGKAAVGVAAPGDGEPGGAGPGQAAAGAFAVPEGGPKEVGLVKDAVEEGAALRHRPGEAGEPEGAAVKDAVFQNAALKAAAGKGTGGEAAAGEGVVRPVLLPEGPVLVNDMVPAQGKTLLSPGGNLTAGQQTGCYTAGRKDRPAPAVPGGSPPPVSLPR